MDLDQNEDDDSSRLPMCSICHVDPPVNGVQLTCGHVFCYLCIKSASETTGVCAMCRTEIGDEFNFQEHQILGTIKLPSSNNGHYWFYEGCRGWWLYDADTNRELEQAYSQGTTSIEKFIAGGVYVIDFNHMAQRRKDDDHGRVRRVRRATLELDNILGMAGLKGKDFQEALEMMKVAETQNRNIPLLR